MKMTAYLVAAAMVVGMASVALSEPAKVVGRSGHVTGTLVKVDGRDLIVRVRQNNGEPKEISLPTDDHTEFRVDGEVGTLDDLRAEMAVSISPTGRGVPGAAKLLVKATSKSLSGVVVKVEGRNIVIKAQQEGEKKEMTVETDGRTKVVFGGENAAGQREGTVAEIGAGMKVKVLPDTGVARKIVVSGVGKGKNK
jgi:hypothetical protein